MSDFSVESVSNTSGGMSRSTNNCVIRVIGVGGGGSNTVQHMINQSVDGVEFIAVNTDLQALMKSTANTKVQIGVKLTNGLGAGCDPNVGRKAAEESKEDLKKLLQGSDMVFITAGMGGGTGTGAAPVIAEIAKETGALTVAVVTKPFRFEGRRHMLNAESGINELSKHVDSLIVIENDKLLKNLGANISIISAFNEANDVLYRAVKGITECITTSAYINVDFADVQTIMRGRGHAMIGSGVGQGANFVEDAIQRAIHSPLIEQVDISSANGLLAFCKLNPNFPIIKFSEICDEIQSYADAEADCVYGLAFDENIAEDQISITILITGISGSDIPGAESPAAVGRPANQNRGVRNFAPAPEKVEGGFFAFSQKQNASRNEPQPHMANFGSARPADPIDFGSHAALDSDHEAASFTEEDVEEVKINPSYSNDSPSENIWEVPPILRNKAD